MVGESFSSTDVMRFKRSAGLEEGELDQRLSQRPLTRLAGVRGLLASPDEVVGSGCGSVSRISAACLGRTPDPSPGQAPKRGANELEERRRSGLERETGLQAPSGKTRVEFTYRLTASS